MKRRRLLRLAAVIVLIPVLPVASWLLAASVLYSPEYVRRVIAWRESDVGDYLTNFPRRQLLASPDPRPFAVALDEDRVEGILSSAIGVDDLEAFLTETETQSLIVIKDDRVVLERYVNGWRRESMVTSFSVAKSFVSTLVGIAIAEGAIGSLDDPITTYLPELAERDPRFAEITIRHLLLMSSGLDYQESGSFLFNGDDPLTTYHPDQRNLALTNIRIAGPPGKTFRYNKYHPQLLGMILERTTGMSVSAWTQSRLWDPLRHGVRRRLDARLGGRRASRRWRPASTRARSTSPSSGASSFTRGHGTGSGSYRPSGWRRRPASIRPTARRAPPWAGSTD